MSAHTASRSFKAASYIEWADQHRTSYLKKVWDSRILLAAGQIKGHKPSAKRVHNLATVLCEDLSIANRHYKTLCSEDPQREDRHL